MVIDPELVLMMNEDILEDYSQRWNTRIIGWVCEGCSCTYGYNLHRAGEKVRSICITNGILTENHGERLPEEKGIVWEKAFEDDILHIAERFGIPYDYLEQDRDYHIYGLDESHIPMDISDSPSKPSEPITQQSAKKPWWKFW